LPNPERQLLLALQLLLLLRLHLLLCRLLWPLLLLLPIFLLLLLPLVLYVQQQRLLLRCIQKQRCQWMHKRWHLGRSDLLLEVQEELQQQWQEQRQ
jgi:hypothetical protein